MAFARAEAIHGRIDLLHLNAGALSGTPDVTQVNADHYRSVTGINIDAVFFGVQAAVPALTRAGGGSILVTSSIAGLTAFDLDPVYAMTKHAVIGLVRALAGTLSRQGIRISAICPDFVDTGFFGTHRQMLAGAGFQMLTAEEVAEAAVAELTDGAAGRLLVVRHGRPPAEHVFAAVD
jgi:NAD(P)-dependent dehydrogenase (short-subunit alcohol dehydrogenase family)